jgi:hypothetical protein
MVMKREPRIERSREPPVLFANDELPPGCPVVAAVRLSLFDTDQGEVAMVAVRPDNHRSR